MTLKKRIGRIIRAGRIAAGHSQAEIAKLHGYSKQYISNIERGVHMCARNCLRRMIEHLKLDREAIIKIMVQEYEKQLRKDLYG